MLALAGENVFTYVLLFIALYFEVFLLVTFLENAKTIHRKDRRSVSRYLPSVTIMVPVWNEENTVVKTISSLLSLKYPKNKLNIFIINDGSTDGTPEILKRYENKQKYPQVSIFHKENGGKHTALNLGLEHVKSELVGCLDADSFVKKDALIHVAEAFADPETMSVVPSIKVARAKNPIELLQSAEYMVSIFMRYIFCSLGSQYITPGPFSFFRTEVFRKIGNYRQAHNTEDMEIALRMQQNGLKIVNAYRTHVFTTAPKTFMALYKQRVRWYHGGFQNLIDYKHLFFDRKHGTLGMFVLPMVAFSIFTIFYIMAFSVLHAASFIIDKISYWQATGWHINPSLPHLDLFTVELNVIVLIGILALLIAGSIILIGKYISDEKIHIGKDMVAYFLLYGFIMPLWFIKPLFNTIFGRRTTWR